MIVTAIATCADADVQSSASGVQTCSSVVWVTGYTVIPELSASQGAAIGGAVMLAFATAWTFKAIHQAMRGY